MNNTLLYNSYTFKTISFTGHRHNDNSKGIECHFLARMLSGSGRIVTLDKEEMELRAGDVFYLPMGLKYHSYWSSDGETPVAWESYRFTAIPTKSSKTYKMQKVDAEGDVLKLLDLLAADKSISPYSVGTLYIFWSKILPTMEEDGSDANNSLMEKAKEYISANPDFKVPELARHCGVSESGLYAFFKKYAGITPVEMKNKMKVEEAVALLSSTDMSVEEISERLGFGTAAYFRNIVKRYTGKTPMKIRKEEEII